MKKITLLLGVLLISTTMFGQKWLQDKAQYLVDAAVKEYKLDEKQEKALFTFYLDHLKEQQKIQQSFKDGDITKEESNKGYKALTVSLRDELVKITSEKPKDIMKFIRETRKAQSSEK